MIILITGASHTGKTLLAQKLLEKYKYPYLSIDLLKMGLIRSGCTSLTPYDDDELTAYRLLRGAISHLTGKRISVRNTWIISNIAVWL